MTIENKYKKLSDIEHCLLRPGRYIGSVNEHTAQTWVFRDESMVMKETTWNPALLKLFDEIISNSVDESKRDGSKLTKIHVTIDETDGSFTVADNGGIPVVIHKDEQMFVPEMIFSELRAGSNFNDDENNVVTGQNGEGAALTNIFSKLFEVETCDGEKKFFQRFTENMTARSKPKITKNKKNGTTIRWIPDYDRLNTTLHQQNIDKIVKRVHDIAACNPHLFVYLNGKRIKYQSFRAYTHLYSNNVIYEANDDWKIGVAPSDNGFQQVSFVNSTETYSGGTHVDYIANQITSKIREHIKKKHKIDVKPNNIKNHLMLFIDAKIVNPRYPSQTKERLITEEKNFGTSFVVSNKMIAAILKSEIVESVLNWVETKKKQEELAALKKTSKALKNKRVAAHIKANTKKRETAILHICEGNSAMANFLNVRNQEIHGGFPLKGKPMNWRNAKSMKDVANNKELSDLMAIIGLEFGKRATLLNYGTIRYSTDADLDGIGSIVGLLNNFFSMWPELFEERRIEILCSPIIIAKKKGEPTKYFYDMETWRSEQQNYKDWQIKYVKGLGGLTEDEYSDMINKPKIKTVLLDNEASNSLKMAFGDDPKERKKWLVN